MNHEQRLHSDTGSITALRTLIRRNEVFALSVVFIFIFLSGFIAYHHEMWRDELQAWMLAKNSASLAELFRNLKYEGHPSLWYIWLMILTRLTESPIAMQVSHLLIAAGTAYILARYSPFPTLVKVLIPFGYFFFYEYSVVARNYAPGILLIFLAASLYEKRFSRLPLLAIVLLLLAHTSVYGTIVVAAITLSLVYEFLLEGKTAHTPGRSTRNTYLGFLIIGLGLISSIAQMVPARDSGAARDWIFAFDYTRAKYVSTILTNAFVPIPSLRFHFWGTNILDPLDYGLRLKFILAAIVFIWALLLMARKPPVLLIYFLGTMGFLAFAYIKYIGTVRHHGIAFILLLACLWLSWNSAHEKPRPIRTVIDVVRRWAYPPLILMLIVHVGAGIVAAIHDYRYEFSAGKSVSQYLQQIGLDQQIIVGDVDYSVSAVAGYTGRKIYYPRGNRFGTFVRWDLQRLNAVSPPDVVSKAIEFVSLTKKDVIVIVNYSLEQDILLANNFVPLADFDKAIIGDESFYIYLAKSS